MSLWPVRWLSSGLPILSNQLAHIALSSTAHATKLAVLLHNSGVTRGLTVPTPTALRQSLMCLFSHLLGFHRHMDSESDGIILVVSGCCQEHVTDCVCMYMHMCVPVSLCVMYAHVPVYMHMYIHTCVYM